MDPRTRNLWLGVGGGLTVGVLIPLVAPLLREVARPVAKALLKHSMLGMDRLRTELARASETMEDLVAEARSEVEFELARERGFSPVPSSVTTASSGAPGASGPEASASGAAERGATAVGTTPTRAKLVS